MNGPDPTGSAATSPGLSVVRYLGDRMPKKYRQICSMNAGYGCLKLNTTVRSSGVVILSIGPTSETTAPALVWGSRMRSNEPFTAAELSVLPSGNLTPSRSVTVNVFDQSVLVHF